ncbi:hypothetical protein BT93_L4930 [Corymbia citriodora subsp. variegata]|uniref:Maltose/galactoside acetyltransferase domain-containing protein n=1 Tax=Corymbia citriodora subsp. variegata TaxID=360336 RepID=A0A8T0CFF2_CORYI|nr:hypothetical protein BT93_L4930 [Corymbia citriodora subsp. variegata]
MEQSENKQRSLRGELYHAFTPELVAERRRCARACARYNNAGEVTRRRQEHPWVEPPIHIDYGNNVRLASNVFINFNCTIIDTCQVSIGSRTLIGPNLSLYSGTHPLDPDLRNGTQGPELGKPITIGEDVWIGGNVTILPGVNVGAGSTVGAGSVVTRNVEPYTVVAGNPAKFIREAPRNTMTAEQKAEIRKIADTPPSASTLSTEYA